jgi:hypothetical protein
MKAVSYLILFVILAICLLMSNNLKTKKEQFGDAELPGMPTDLVAEHIEPDSVKLKWKSSSQVSPITGYMIMLKKSDNQSKGIYLNFKSDAVDCINCEYTITNMPLVAQTYYTVGVLAINNNGAGLPARVEFQTKTKAAMPRPTTSTSSSSKAAASSSAAAALDPYLDNMIARADGIYSFNKGVLEYPDTFEEDAKNSLATLNDEVIKELQEGRINIHIGGS